jgi:hypothetical protein
VTRADGTPAVLKLLILREVDVASNEITVLLLAGGDGCPRLFRHDEHRGALLMEELGPPMSELSIPILQRHEILCSAAARLWRPAPDSGLPTGAEKGRWLIGFITSRARLVQPDTRSLDPRPWRCSLASRVPAGDPPIGRLPRVSGAVGIEQVPVGGGE